MPKVHIKENEPLEKALRRFKKKLEREGTIREVKARKHYGESLLDAATFIRVVEDRQGLKIACPEEIAYRMNYIDREQLARLAQPLLKNGYGQYLLRIAEEVNIR